MISKKEEYFSQYRYSLICFPNLLSTRIIQPLPDDCVLVLHDLVPRHELIDFFPTLLPDNIDNGLRCVEKDEAEKPFRYSHRYAKVRLLFYICSFVIEFFSHISWKKSTFVGFWVSWSSFHFFQKLVELLAERRRIIPNKEMGEMQFDDLSDPYDL